MTRQSPEVARQTFSQFYTTFDPKGPNPLICTDDGMWVVAKGGLHATQLPGEAAVAISAINLAALMRGNYIDPQLLTLLTLRMLGGEYPHDSSCKGRAVSGITFSLIADTPSDKLAETVSALGLNISDSQLERAQATAAKHQGGQSAPDTAAAISALNQDPEYAGIKSSTIRLKGRQHLANVALSTTAEGLQFQPGSAASSGYYAFNTDPARVLRRLAPVATIVGVTDEIDGALAAHLGALIPHLPTADGEPPTIVAIKPSTVRNDGISPV